MLMATYELRSGTQTLCASSIPNLGYSYATLQSMEHAGLKLYKDGKREKPPRSCQIGSGKENKTTNNISNHGG